MKIFVKTLKGDRFEIQVKPEDSVADVKKNIETVLGVTASYPAAEQVLIHKGKVLKDDTTLEANNVSEKSTIAVMKRKPASTGTSTASANLKPHAHATPTEPAWDAGASNGNYESVSESNFKWILEVAGGDLVIKRNEKCTNDQTEEPEASRDAANEWPLDLWRHTPELIQDNEVDFLRLVFEQPHEHQDNYVLHFQTNEPNNGGDSGNQVGESEETEVEQPQADQTNKPTNNGGNQVGETKETEVEVPTPEDYELIERLEALGFDRGDAAVAYFACNRNVQVAANHLLGYKHESQE